MLIYSYFSSSPSCRLTRFRYMSILPRLRIAFLLPSPLSSYSLAASIAPLLRVARRKLAVVRTRAGGRRSLQEESGA